VDGRVLVFGSGAASSPDCERRCLILLGGIVRVIFQDENTVGTKYWDSSLKA
jgi:hypothetical protein